MTNKTRSLGKPPGNTRPAALSVRHPIYSLQETLTGLEVDTMKSFEKIEDVGRIEPSCVALGNFDGVHIGHSKLIQSAAQKAKEKNLASAVFTFSTHPKSLIPGAKPVKNIVYGDEKEALIRSLGMEYYFNFPFTESIMTMSPENFVKIFLCDMINAREVFCGFNYHFGYKGEGDTKLLRILGAKYGFRVNEIKAVSIDGDVVSSTLIRNMIMAGEMEECSKYLGRNYDIGGEVVVGNRLGRKIGFPTSNIMIDESMVTPPNGVYVTYCIYNGTKYPSVTNVGIKPTVGAFQKNMETHIFNFDKELYGKQIKVEFIKKTRDEVKFGSIEELSAQIARDCNEAKAYHGL